MKVPLAIHSSCQTTKTLMVNPSQLLIETTIELQIAVPLAMEGPGGTTIVSMPIWMDHTMSLRLKHQRVSVGGPLQMIAIYRLNQLWWKSDAFDKFQNQKGVLTIIIYKPIWMDHIMILRLKHRKVYVGRPLQMIAIYSLNQLWWK